MTEALERMARNRLLFRAVNERLAALFSSLRGNREEFLCECGNPGCIATIMLSLEEYERTHAAPDRFVVAPGHASEFNRIVEEDDRFSLVQAAPKAQSSPRAMEG